MKRMIALLIALALVAGALTGCAALSRLMHAAEDRLAGKNTLPPMPLATALPTESVYEASECEVMDDGFVMNLSAMPAAGEEFNTEEYAAIAENGFKAVATSPLSTFSADVDTASYCNLRRMLNNGVRPAAIPAGAVRVEEMLNYFRYDYAAPADGERFAVTAEIADCPWNSGTKLLRLGVRAAALEAPADAGSNLVFLMDVSGSMAYEDKLELAKRAMVLLLDELGENDTVSIVTYASGEEILIEGANPVSDKAALISTIDRLVASGSTYGEKGLRQAYEVAQRHFRRGGNNRVILCSDGDLNVGITSQSDLHDFVTEKKETGVYLSVLGFGEGNYKDTKMETLADDGNGNYYYIDSILEARKVLCEELTQTLFTVADDVKFQVEFNPAKVAAYRQIGYENRSLANEDFEDDRKDAGEVGSGACVTVLYELMPAGDGAAESGLRYQDTQLTEAAAGDEWLTVSIRSKAPGAQESELQTVTVGEAERTDAPSGDFRFACAVAEFGMILSGSDYAGDADYQSVLDLLKEAPLSDPYREEFFSLVKIAQRAEALGK